MTKKEQQFVTTVWEYYQTCGRHDLPWRRTTDPYRIVVSEVMLQQTQVARVQQKYREFLKAFPTTRQLAAASLTEVLHVWQGLGYNRRAKLLQQAAVVISSEQAGRWPRTYEGMLAVPGIGPYTAGAVLAFAYNIPVPIIETNIRTVFLHHFYPLEATVSDADIKALVATTLPLDNPREWYWALMDYGAHLKRTGVRRNQQSRHYVKQAPFVGSVREVRGAVIRILGEAGALSRRALLRRLATFPEARRIAALQALETEGMITYDTRTKVYQLAT